MATTNSSIKPAIISSSIAKKIDINEPAPLQGIELIVAALFLAVANFMVVLDMTIVNVSLPHIAGGLAVSPTEGTYAITSYAVAEAITVPLTGWLAKRFGTLRTFILCIVLFGIFSAFCGFATSIGSLIVGRTLQGVAGGPLMPLAQTLLMSIFPKNKKSMAIGLWSMTTLIAPICGPILGGYISDVWSWEYIFFINIPIVVFCTLSIMKILKRFETRIVKEKIDFIGMLLLIFWVGCFQIMLDEGKNHDWFESTYICILGICAIIGLICFLIWELTHEKPIIDLKVFRHRGFTISVITISLAFGAFFSSIVLLPLWLQGNMGYNATSAGFVSSGLGIFAVFAAPLVAKLSDKVDSRKLVCCGVLWLGIFTLIRSFATTDMTASQIRLPILFQGLGMPMFFIPLTALALSSVKTNEIASAAGLMSFVRTLSGAFATSLVITGWENQIKIVRTDIISSDFSLQKLTLLLENNPALDVNTGKYVLEHLLHNQAVMIATNQIFFYASMTFIFAAITIWFAPKPRHKVDLSSAH